MSKCKKVEPLVLEILKTKEETRSDDFLLIYEVYKNYLPDIDTLSFKEVMLNHRELNIPSFETVRRTRPKLQNKYPDLQPPEIIQQLRKEAEEDYRSYVLSDN